MWVDNVAYKEAVVCDTWIVDMWTRFTHFQLVVLHQLETPGHLAMIDLALHPGEAF